MNERLLRLYNDFAFMRKAGKALLHDKRGQRTPLLIAQLATTACREIKAGLRLRSSQLERFGTRCNQSPDFT